MVGIMPGDATTTNSSNDREPARPRLVGNFVDGLECPQQQNIADAASATLRAAPEAPGTPS
jgi:hypothetical protein